MPEINREKLISDNLYMVKIIARQISSGLPSVVDVEDLISAGTIGLIECVERYDETRGVQFGTFASKRIRGAIIDELRRSDWMTRSMREKSKNVKNAYAEIEKRTGGPAQACDVARYLGLSDEDFNVLVGEVAASIKVDIDDCNFNFAGEYALEIEFLKNPYGADPMSNVRLNQIKSKLAAAVETLLEKEKALVALYYYDEMTLGEIGSILDASESRVCQVHARTMAKLRDILKDEIGVQ